MRTFIFGWNVQTWTYFLPGLEDLIASSGNILRCLLAMRTILRLRGWCCDLAGRTTNPTLMLAQEANYQRQPVSVSSKMELRHYCLRPASDNHPTWQTPKLCLYKIVSDCGGVVEATLEATFSSPAAAAVCLVESLKLARLRTGWEVDRRLRLNWIMNPPKERTRTNAQNIDAHQLSWRATWVTDNILLLDHFFVTVRSYSSIVMVQ